MSSIERAISVLDLFAGEHLEWNAEDLQRELNCSRSTLYRYIKILTDADLLTSMPGARYALGPKIVQLDYELRSSDPIYKIAQPLLTELAAETRGVAVLCRMYRDKILCIHREIGNDAPRTFYERGKTMPIVRGASARVILSRLPTAKQKEIYDQHADEFAQIGMGHDFEAVQKTLRTVGAQGFSVALGEIVPNNYGIAAPVTFGAKKILGSISVTLDAKSVSKPALPQITDRVVFCGRVLSQSLRQQRAI